MDEYGNPIETVLYLFTIRKNLKKKSSIVKAKVNWS